MSPNGGGIYVFAELVVAMTMYSVAEESTVSEASYS